MSLRIGIGLIGFMIYMLFVYVLGEKALQRQNLNHRLEKIKSSHAYDAHESAHLTLPLSERILKPTFGRLVSIISSVIPLSKHAQEQLRELLRSAGIKKNAHEYVSTMIAIYILISIGISVIASVLLHKSLIKVFIILLYLLVAFFIVVRFLLKKKVTDRMRKIENDVPEILDLLSVSVSAGLGFDQALQYVTERCQGELTSELEITQREIKFGKSRKDAMKALSDRCEVETLHMFVSALNQADTLGIAISNILQVQAENARHQHKQSIEEKAAKLPVKILIPLVLFIFPNIFIILLGPAVPRVLSAFS